MEAVQTREECEMAAAMLGLDFRKAESATDYPKGCYHLDIGNIEGSLREFFETFDAVKLGFAGLLLFSKVVGKVGRNEVAYV